MRTAIPQRSSGYPHWRTYLLKPSSWSSRASRMYPQSRSLVLGQGPSGRVHRIKKSSNSTSQRALGSFVCEDRRATEWWRRSPNPRILGRVGLRLVRLVILFCYDWTTPTSRQCSPAEANANQERRRQTFTGAKWYQLPHRSTKPRFIAGRVVGGSREATRNAGPNRKTKATLKRARGRSAFCRRPSSTRRPLGGRESRVRHRFRRAA